PRTRDETTVSGELPEPPLVSSVSSLVLKRSDVGQCLRESLRLRLWWPFLNVLTGVLATTFLPRLAISCTRALRATTKRSVSTSVCLFSDGFLMCEISEGSTFGVVSAGGALSTTTGGGANSCESSAGGVSGTNCSADSFGRTVMTPAKFGSVSCACGVP